MTPAALRRARGLTQAALAARLGVHANTVARWERGEHAPSVAHLIAWARQIGASVDLLLGIVPVCGQTGKAAELDTLPPRGREGAEALSKLLTDLGSQQLAVKCGLLGPIRVVLAMPEQPPAAPLAAEHVTIYLDEASGELRAENEPPTRPEGETP